MEQKLEKLLFSENLYAYAILDGASVPDLLAKFYELRPPHVCLYRGELDDDLAEVAPYLVNLIQGTKFTSWLLSNCWGRHWGIFLHSPFPNVELRKHFRRFLTVHDENGNPLLFRYYDPRVLPKFLPTCRPDELEMFFAQVKSIFAETDDAGAIVRMQCQNKQLKQTRFEMKGGNDQTPPSAPSAPHLPSPGNQVAEFSYV